MRESERVDSLVSLRRDDGIIWHIVLFAFGATAHSGPWPPHSRGFYEGWNFNSGNYLFTTDTK